MLTPSKPDNAPNFNFPPALILGIDYHLIRLAPGAGAGIFLEMTEELALIYYRADMLMTRSDKPSGKSALIRNRTKE